MRGRHLRVHRLDRGEDRDLRPLHAERHRQVDGVLADVHLVLERRRDVDRRVGDDQHLVIGRHVHEEDVADAAARAQARLAGRRPRRAVRRCAGCPSSAVRPRPRAPVPPPCAAAAWLCGDVDDLARRRGRCPVGLAISAIFAAGPTRIGTIRPCRGRLDRAGQRRRLAGMRHRRRDRRRGRGTAPAAVRTCRFRYASCVSHEGRRGASGELERRGDSPSAPQQSTTETARPPSEVSLYFEFISLAVSAIAFDRRVEVDAAVGRDLVARDHEAGPRLDRAERAALDAGHLHVAGDRVAGHAEVMLQRRLGGVGDHLVVASRAPGR